jgi:hypothetical protein
MTDIERIAREADVDLERLARYAMADTGVVVCADRVWLARFAQLIAAECATIAQHTVCDTHLPTGVRIYGTAAAKAIREKFGA